MAENNWLLQDGRSILVEFETAATEKAWGWFGNRSSGEGLEFDAAAAAWTDHAWLRGGKMVMPAEAGGAVTIDATTQNLVLTAYPATVTVATDVQSGTQNLVLTQYPANVALDINVNATTQELLLTQYSATVETSVAVEVFATTQALVLTQYQVGVELAINVDAGTQSLTLTVYPATVDAPSIIAEPIFGGSGVSGAWGRSFGDLDLNRKPERKPKEPAKKRKPLFIPEYVLQAEQELLGSSYSEEAQPIISAIKNAEHEMTQSIAIEQLLLLYDEMYAEELLVLLLVA